MVNLVFDDLSEPVFDIVFGDLQGLRVWENLGIFFVESHGRHGIPGNSETFFGNAFVSDIESFEFAGEQGHYFFKHGNRII